MRQQVHKEGWSVWAPSWEKYEKCIDGRPVIESELYQYPTEDDSKYAYRKKISVWSALPSEIMARQKQTFLKADVRVELPTDEDLSLVENSFGAGGKSAQKWRGEVFDELNTYGRVWALVDEPRWEDRPDNATEADRRNAGIRPYVALYSCPHVLNWDYDQRGALVFVRTDTGMVAEVDGREVDLYRDFTRTEVGYAVTLTYWREAKGEIPEGVAALESEGEYTLTDADGKPVLPWVVKSTDLTKSDPNYPRSPMAGVFDKSIQLYNSNGQREAYFAKAAFSAIVMPEGGDVKQFGQSSIITENAQTKGVTRWVNPDSTVFEAYRVKDDQLIREVFVLAGVRQTQDNVVDNRKSGAAISEERVELRDKVGGVADDVRDVELDCRKLICYRLGKHKLVGKVGLTYPTDYDVYGLEQELQRLEKTKLTQNRKLYEEMFRSFANRKISDPDTRAAIVLAETKSRGMTLDTLSKAAPVIPLLLQTGVLSVADLARMIDPELSPDDDAAVMTVINAHAEQAAELANLGFGLPASTPVPATEGEI